MIIKQGNTELIHDRIARCEDVEELKEILNKDSSYYQDWKRFINAIVEVNHLSYEKLGKLCNCSKNTAKRWCIEGKLPQNRETFIKIALGLVLNLQQTNDLLQRFGKYPKLYPKCMEDAIHIFVINHPVYDKDPYDYYQALKKECLEQIKRRKKQTMNTSRGALNTQLFMEELISKNTQDNFEQFLLDNCDVFKQSYQKLVEYIDMFIISKNDNIHEFVRLKGISTTFEKMISSLKNKREVPNRTRLIALGVHLNMSLEQLNEMLNLANMEPVCAKDKVECAVIYAVESAHLNNPEYAYENALYLKDYVQKEEIKKQCSYIIQEYMNSNTFCKIGDFREYPNMEDEISEYLKWVLKEIELDTEEIYALL